ncbi:dna methyltransferase [Leptolyngbya sp. Heron Island J]|uniref:class I SAM-dependent DNA methyltransferase n=1 Tax=Leptolyngbya sp. Heron Island J TaxID=1385935 RepID=UPI0003B958DD|nr:N-6 DNA methylase [Leptolyngbya sp. Heron Island J]ESA35111.1 dna methyltransferase [Leptolyngbya sp. Heron Island J]
MSQLETIGAIEKNLWNAADTLRSNSSYASNEYFMPVMGLIFLRHAYSRFLAVKKTIKLPSRGGKTRALRKEDFSQKNAIFLKPEAQFDYLVSLTDSDDRVKKLIKAMKSIEEDYETLKGALPKAEYQELDNEVLGKLLRTLNPEELKTATGDIFGRIYEYFLTRFAGEKAHDGGEFFTPVSLVSLIANVLEPDHGIVFDPACGSGGMFVQSARFLERRHDNPQKLLFRGLEKNGTTIRLAKMNLAVHGLEGDIQKAITYYEDPAEMVGKADYVMANPPFNVDEVDEGKITKDPRLPFGLPGVNKDEKVSNGNYLWISYFYSYLNEKGRAGFVMSSQASSAGRDEAKVRKKLVETGDVEVMIAIRQNFFYTRPVPCELWFLNRAKPEDRQNQVLMIDARNIYHKVTRKIYDFSPEQLQNILAIVWLYRKQEDRFLELVKDYLAQTLKEAQHCFFLKQDDTKTQPCQDYTDALLAMQKVIQPFVGSLNKEVATTEPFTEFQTALDTVNTDIATFYQALEHEQKTWTKEPATTNAELNEAVDRLAPMANQSRDLVKQADLVYKLAVRLIDHCEQDLNAKENDHWPKSKEISSPRKQADTARQAVVAQLKQVWYFHKQAVWLTERFPKGTYQDVEGLVALVDRESVDRKTIAQNDWSLTPGRYVGVAPEEEDEDFDFEEALREIHVELEGLNQEASELAIAIAKNFEELGV